MKHAYLFEARGIQRFLFASGKLKDMLGGSELLDYLCAEGGYLDQVLEKFDPKPGAPRRAGAAFYLLFNSEDDARRFQTVWRLGFSNWVPGVEYVDTLSSAESALKAVANGQQALREQRNILSAELPRPGPLSERSPRTGIAAIKRDSKQKGEESLDAATATKRQFQRPDEDKSLAKRFLNEDGYFWPNDFEQDTDDSTRFPLAERRLVGLVHADGNGLGELLRVLGDALKGADDKAYKDIFRAFSDGLTTATQEAAQAASKAIILPAAEKQILPARPLVLGGDDVTIILRADLALPFTTAFLKAFEEETAKSMDKLKGAFKESKLPTPDLPDKLTACAGICYMKCSQPFLAGHDLAEGLCKRAKTASRQQREERKLPYMPASLAFHKVQDSLLDDAKSQFDKDHRIQDSTGKNQSWTLALPVYGLSADNKLPQITDLEALVKLFAKDEKSKAESNDTDSSPKANRKEPDINDRPLREVVTLWHSNRELARQAYTRWRTLAAENQRDQLKEFDTLLHKLVGDTQQELPCSTSRDAQSPIADLLSLLTLHNSQKLKQEADA